MVLRKPMAMTKMPTASSSVRDKPKPKVMPERGRPQEPGFPCPDDEGTKKRFEPQRPQRAQRRTISGDPRVAPTPGVDLYGLAVGSPIPIPSPCLCVSVAKSVCVHGRVTASPLRLECEWGTEEGCLCGKIGLHSWACHRLAATIGMCMGRSRGFVSMARGITVPPG